MTRIISLTPNPTFDYAVSSEFVVPNRKLRCHSPDTNPGGGGINVARAAHRLGANVLAIFTIGGLYGDALIREMTLEGVPTRAIPISGDTRLAFHVHNEQDNTEYRFNLPGSELLQKEAEAIMSAVSEEASEGDFVVGSGSLPPGAPEDFWAQAAHASKAKGARFVLDSVNGFKPALEEGLFLFRQNMFEYEALSGRVLAWPDEIIEFAQTIVSNGKVENYSITHGGDGTIMASADGNVYKSGAFSVPAKSAVGAGDSYVASLLVALQRGFDNNAALRYGMAGAAATRLTPGTELFDPNNVEKFFNEGKANAV